MMIERTLVLMKPDAVRRGLTGEILTRFERAGLKVVGMKMVWADRNFLKKHYDAHVDKKFYKSLENYIVNGPVVAAVIEGVEVIGVVRKMCGDTEPKKALPGTIRGDFTHHSYGHVDPKGTAIKNVIHASGSKQEAEKEVKLWFDKDELHTYSRADEDEHY
ncbi:nucleoside-diphosphate kinase [Nanoarchaeota archaeon]